MILPSKLVQSRKRTDTNLSNLKEGLEVAEAPEIVSDRACVYATGSLGRGEMSERSDLDLFILRNGTGQAALTNLDEIRLQAKLIEVARSLNYVDFSGDGKYLKAHDVKKDLIGKLGTSEDDYVNVFTARMLLLLESRPILGVDVYKRTLDEVVSEYWRDFPQNSNNFLPIFLVNDILRFWKTLCLNYEGKTASQKDSDAGKRRLQNYKLKHSRLLTCYSGIIYLQAILYRDNNTVSPEAVMQMVSESPTKRLESVATIKPETEESVQTILDSYSKFLTTCDSDKSELEQRFTDSEFKMARLEEAKQFGDGVFKLLHLMGAETPLFRYLVV